MSETLEPMTDEDGARELAEQLLAQAKQQGVDLVGPDGLLNRLTKNVLESALDAELAEHPGYEKHDPGGRGPGNSRNGSTEKQLLTETGTVLCRCREIATARSNRRSCTRTKAG